MNSQDEVCGTGLKDQQVLNVSGYSQLFQHSVETLRSQLAEKGEGAELVWDKVSALMEHYVQSVSFSQPHTNSDRTG